MHILDNPTRNLFFTGKGGVGKTSTSCAVALGLTQRGCKALLVSTDPASNLDEIFAQAIGSEPTPIAGVDGLWALNVDPEAAAAAYRERVVGPYRNLLPAVAVASIEEQLSGACTVEIAAFDEFAKLLGDPSMTAAFDHIVFDTAPTGHTLRLLSLPAAWTGFIENAKGGTSCLGPLQGLVAQRDLYAAAVRALADPARTTLVLVSRPDQPALAEAARTSEELAALDIRNQALVVNGVFRASDRSDPVAQALERRGEQALRGMPARLAPLPRHAVPLKPRQVVGVKALRHFLDPSDASEPAPAAALQAGPFAGLERLADELEAQGPGVVMTMGKGGVGKTTVAAELARELARRGHRVHLTTTDPAAHVAAAVGRLPDGLTVGEINPAREVAQYRQEVIATTGANLDEAGRALLQEELSSPCTEEIAVFQAFARTVARARDEFVVIDTAPTGHSILLLDAAQAYHREVTRQAKAVPEAVLQLLPRLRDQRFTRIVLCALAEATPVHEAAALQEDLRRAGIEPYGWVITQSLLPLAVRDPLLAARRRQELAYVEEVTQQHAARTFLVPWHDAAAPAEAGARTAAAVA